MTHKEMMVQLQLLVMALNENNGRMDPVKLAAKHYGKRVGGDSRTIAYLLDTPLREAFEGLDDNKIKFGV